MKFIGMLLLGILVALSLTALLALPVQWLWNMVMPQATHWAREISWLEAWGLILLTHLLFRFELVTKKSD